MSERFTPKLSIIVPVYNTEQYLPKCINSILAQTFTDFESIFTDDGSSDDSGSILDGYAVQDSRVIIIHQPNAGVSSARNKGLDIATGNYVGFVDSDDWIELEMYEIMLQASACEKYDVVCCAYNDYDSDYRFVRTVADNRLFLDRFSLMREQFGMPNRLTGSACNKIFKRQNIIQVRFPKEITFAEDWLFLFYAYEKSNKAVKISNSLYNVYTRHNSVTHIETVDNFYEPLSKSKLLLLLLLARRHSIELEKFAVDKYLDDCVRYLPRLVSVGKENHEKFMLKYIHIKILMLREIIRATLYRLLPRKKICGYLYAWSRL